MPLPKLYLFLMLPSFGRSKQLSLAVTGDVNLNPNLTASELADPTFVWGDMLPVIRSTDLFCIAVAIWDV